MNTPRILVLAGSTRRESIHRKLASQVVETLNQTGLSAEFADLRDYPMPLYDGDLEAESGPPPAARALKLRAAAADAFVFASPEYNGSYPAVLKNAIDWISRPAAGERPGQVFRGKAAAILSASPGPGGGSRGLGELRHLLEMISVHVIPEQLSIPGSSTAFNQSGQLARQEDLEGLARLATGLKEKTYAYPAQK